MCVENREEVGRREIEEVREKSIAGVINPWPAELLT